MPARDRHPGERPPRGLPADLRAPANSTRGRSATPATASRRSRQWPAPCPAPWAASCASSTPAAPRASSRSRSPPRATRSRHRRRAAQRGAVPPARRRAVAPGALRAGGARRVLARPLRRRRVRPGDRLLGAPPPLPLAGARPRTTRIARRLVQRARVLVAELARRDEPLYWAASLPELPEALLEDIAFVRELGRFPTHLSGIERPAPPRERSLRLRGRDACAPSPGPSAPRTSSSAASTWARGATS